MSNDSKAVWIVLAIAAAVVFMAVMCVGLVGALFFLGVSRTVVIPAPMSVSAPGTQTAVSQAVPQTVSSAGISPTTIMDKAHALRAGAGNRQKYSVSGVIHSADDWVKARGMYQWGEFSKTLENPEALIQALTQYVGQEIERMNAVLEKDSIGSDPITEDEKTCFTPDKMWLSISGKIIIYEKDKKRYSVQLSLRKEQGGAPYPYRLWICVSALPPAKP